jgi:GDPmannose 4,6-dehydratase
MRSALIFGANGQDAHYLAELCRKQGIEPISCSRSEGPWLQCDVSDHAAVNKLVRDRQPSLIFHLAARSTTKHDALFDNHAAIATGTLNVLESARLHAPDARVFLTGSGVQFRNTGKPISENDEFEASSPYALARIHSVYAGRYYRSLKLRVFVGYLFHHESPLRKPTHISKMIADAARRIADGSKEVIELGDISVEKEYTFAGDVAAGILALVSQDAVFEAAIGSGAAYSIRDWLDACFGAVGVEWRDRVKLREGFVPDFQRLVSDPKTMHQLGWRPKVGFAELAAFMTGKAAVIQA